MAEQNTGGGGVLEQVANAIKKDEREALKKSLRSKVTEYRVAAAAADVILTDITTTLVEAGESAEGIAELLKG